MQIATDEIRKEIKIQNIICTADLQQNVPIVSFRNFSWGIHDEEIYGGVCGYIKIHEIGGKVSVFANGKMISYGAKTFLNAENQINQAKFLLVKNNLIRNCKLKPVIQNVVARFELGRKLSLKDLARTMPKAMYEPEQFPGLIFRIKGSLVALIFASGKGILTGGKSINELNHGLFEIEHWIID